MIKINQRGIALLFFTVTFFVFSMNAKAQKAGGNLHNKVDTVNKVVLDNAKFRVFYTMEFVNDSTDIGSKKECQTILLIGTHYHAFLDYNNLRKDSLYDALAKRNASSMEVISAVLPIAKQAKFAPVIIRNYPGKGTATFQQTVLSKEVYRYSSPVELQWALGNDEKEVMGYKCKNATAHYRGRQYTAWYAPDIPISEGPYVFSGLPGLVMNISDAKGHYTFTINGLKTVSGDDSIYLPTDHVVEASRDQVRKIISNTKNNPESVLKSLAGNSNISEETMRRLQPKPYNPIELE